MTIAQLRAEPADALARFLYHFTVPALASASQGTVDAIGTSMQTTTLTYRPGSEPGIDYFFPYGRHPIAVTVENPADGAIAITPAMNGCSLQVNESGGKFYFYHDPDGKKMAQAEPPATGTKVCHITSAAYWDEPWAVNNMRGKDFMAGYQFVCVHRGGTWHVGAFRFATDRDGAVKGGGPGVGPSVNSSYLGSFSSASSLILDS